MEKKKFNINNYFNQKLFFEAFKQIRIVALIFFVCLSTAAMFLPVMMKDDYVGMYSENKHELLLHVADCMYPLLALVFVAVPIMYIVLFNFQTKRNSSDFYHSLPVKRSCQFLSYIAAIFSWLLIITITYTLLFLISANITYEYFILDYSVFACYAINIIISCGIIIGILSIGTSLTGTMTSNIISSLSILIIPRFVIFAIVDMIDSHSMTLSYDKMWFVLTNKCNIVFSQLIDTISFENNGSVMCALSKYSVYSVILAIVYIIIGLKLFTTRPSEIATKSFRTKKVFSALKIGTGFLISIILVVEIYEDAINFDFVEISENMVTYILLIIAMGLSMFALEAAFTKSIKSGLKTILLTPFILLLDVIIIFGVSAINNYYDNIESFNPKNVDYVRVAFDYDDYLSINEEDEYFYYEGLDVFKSALHNTKITDNKIIDFLLDIHNSDRTKMASDMPYHHYKMVEVTFDSTFSEKTRYVYLTDMEYKTLGDMLLDNSDIQKKLISYPDLDTMAIIVSGNLTRKQSHNLYESLLKEVNAITDPKTLIELFNVHANHSLVDNATLMFIQCYYNGEYCTLEIPITPLTPDTYTLYLEYENAANKKNVLDILNKVENGSKDISMTINGNIYNLLQDGTTTEDYLYRQNGKVSSLDNNFTILKNYINDYYLNNKTLNYNDFISGDYYIGVIRLLYDYNSTDYYEEDYLSGVVTILIPKDSAILNAVEEDDILDGGYDIEVTPEDESNKDFQVEPESQSNGDFQVN